MGEAADKTEKKREASSPPEKPPDDKKRVIGDKDHTVHPSVTLLHNNEVASPVSTNNSHVLTAKTLIPAHDEMGAVGSPPDYNVLLKLITDLEKRVVILESERTNLIQLVESQNKELLSVRSENASLQTHMSQVADVSSHNSDGDSSQPSSPMMTEEDSVTRSSDTENIANADAV